MEGKAMGTLPLPSPQSKKKFLKFFKKFLKIYTDTHIGVKLRTKLDIL